MDSVLLASPPVSPAPSTVGCAAGSTYDGMLKESVDRFLVELRMGSCDFSVFRSIFFRLLQSSADPPLEIVWFYAAVSYHEGLASKKGMLDRILAVRDLLQLIIACSSSCGGPKSVALVAPVVSELYHVIVEVEGLSGSVPNKEMKKLRREVDHLVEGVLGYISVCSGKGFEGGGGCADLLPCFTQLVRVWMVKRGDDGNEMRLFFPLVNEEIRGGLNGEKCGVDFLAGVVEATSFLLRILSKFQFSGTSRAELQKELTVWAVGSITSFGKCGFYEVLLRLLLDSPLPSFLPLDPKDEAFLRDILYDSVLLVEYSFLCPSDVEQLFDTLRPIALTRVIVFHEAIQAARKVGSHRKAISYTNAFSRSCLASGLVKWITNQTGTVKLSKPNVTTPQALLKWLLSLQERGVMLLENDILKFCKKLSFDESKLVCQDRIYKADSEKGDDDLFFFDNKGEIADDLPLDYEMEVSGDIFASAAESIKSGSNGRRKRKGSKGKTGETRVKFIKYKLDDSTANEYFSVPKKDDASSGSEVENPLSDEDMDEMEE